MDNDQIVLEWILLNLYRYLRDGDHIKSFMKYRLSGQCSRTTGAF